MTTAKAVPGIVLTNTMRIDGDLVLETSCRDYAHFCSLPDIVSYCGEMCGKTGWSSDRNIACYKSSANIALDSSAFPFEDLL